MPTIQPILTALLSLCLLCGCGFNTGTPPAVNTTQAPDTITVMAAASLTDAFREIGQLYEQQNPGNTAEFIFAGSQQLAQQISQGAPADIFASASSAQIDSLVKAGSVDADAVSIFAHNRLVVIYPRELSNHIQNFEDLRTPGLKLVLAAREVPAGQYSFNALESASQQNALGTSFQKEVLDNVVSYENNVRTVLTKVMLGEADAGIVYISDVSGSSQERIGQIPIPAAYNPAARYPIAVMKDSQLPLQAQAFVETVLSPAGQQILENYGFESAAP